VSVNSRRVAAGSICLFRTTFNQEWLVGRYWRNFWSATVSLAGLVGLYLGAIAVDLTWAFYAVIVLAAIIAGVHPLTRWAITIGIKVRNYQKLLDMIADLQAKVAAADTARDDVILLAENAWEKGVVEGRAQIIGAYTSSQFECPDIISIACVDDCPVLVTTMPSQPEHFVGARFRLVAVQTGETKGYVEVDRVDIVRSVVYMRPIVETVPEFWRHLRERAAYDHSAPPGCGLEYYGREDFEATTRWRFAAPDESDELESQK